MPTKNPFSPTFGASPPVLAGRDDILADIDDALETGTTHPDYTTLFIGVRGAGKTVMLNATEDLARERGWLTVAENASPTGLLDRLTAAAVRHLETLDERAPTTRIASVSGLGFGVAFEHEDEPSEPALRTALTALGTQLAAHGTGLMITLDELQSGDLAEIREFGATIQHVTRREGLPIAFAGASLPQIDDTLLSDDDIATFLQRCSRYDVDQLDRSAATHAIEGPIIERGGRIDADDLDRCVEAAAGYAFMVQLVGFYTWKAAADPTTHISASAATAGIAEAERRIGRLIFAPTWKGLSDVDRRFLIAMASDDGDSRLATIADRLDVDTNYAGVYRRRLINAGVISSSGRGRVEFAHPAMRGWIRSGPAETTSTSPDDD